MARSLAKLPTEIIQIITSYLPNSDIKTLRRTCKAICNTVQLRLNRVFLSANPLNIAVFLAIANSDTFRHGDREIIWDDARFHTLPANALFYVVDKESRCPNIDRQIDRTKQIAANMTMERCWQYFQTLFHEQEDVISFNKDAEALRYGFPRLPAVKRVTITPVAHGWIFNPLYETPMIRAFPKGFNYPIPRGWSDSPGGDVNFPGGAWEVKEVRQEFPGFGIVTRDLADYTHHQVSECIIDATGLADQHSQIGHAVWIEQEVQAFLYGDGANPFVGNEKKIVSGVGIVRDSFESGY
ncbi:hypothetical protein BJX99DRAFT_256117 [Aspergillus californicus]